MSKKPSNKKRQTSDALAGTLFAFAYLHRVNDDLIIETGERRYWAHWLLVLNGHSGFTEIRGSWWKKVRMRRHANWLKIGVTRVGGLMGSSQKGYQRRP